MEPFFSQLRLKFFLNPDQGAFNDFIVAFGGGALISTVALILVPRGISNLSLSVVCSAFVLRGVIFFFIDYICSRVNSGLSNFIAMLTDYVPEALALSASIALSDGDPRLVAFLIVIQNLPEGYSAHI